MMLQALGRAATLALTVVGLGLPIGAQAPGPKVTAADVRFMQDMIGHHAQAVEMTALVRTRTRRAEMRALSERIAVSQTDEMAIMRQWLEAHAAAFPAAAAHEMHADSKHGMIAAAAMPMMPGMLSPAQMQTLRRASGPRFDRLFLEGMIRHHGGALAMVESLMATPGAAQESSLNRFVTDVDTDQRAEIARMRRMLSRR